MIFVWALEKAEGVSELVKIRNMIQNDNGTIICEREEILNNKIKVLDNPFFLNEYQFHVLIENKC